METETESSPNAFEIVNWRKNEFAKSQWDDDHDDIAIKLNSLLGGGGSMALIGQNQRDVYSLHDWLALKRNSTFTILKLCTTKSMHFEKRKWDLRFELTPNWK